jgi:transposase
MTQSPGIDVSPETSSICIVDAQGAIQRELKVESEPEAMAAALMGTGFIFSRIGLEAGPLSQWLHAGPAKAALQVVLLETRQLRATKAMPVKTDWNDARAMAQVVRTRLVQGGAREVGTVPGLAARGRRPGPAQRPQAAGGPTARPRQWHPCPASWPCGSASAGAV